MRQEQFVARHQGEWQAFEHWLHSRGGNARQARGERNPTAVNDEDVPARYRRICEQLALARKRGYSPAVTSRLQTLMQEGHQLLYRPAPARWQRALQFVMADFPRLVRSQAACMWAACALFALPLLLMMALLQSQPELIHGVMAPEQIAEYEQMYNPQDPRFSEDRAADGDWQMFGHYIMNNISIGLRTFASGLLLGIGTVVVLVMNGVMIGSVFGHLLQIGHGQPLLQFAAGHGAFELTAIVIAGGAGLRLGYNLIAPGRRRRIEALVEAGRIGARLCLGVALMLLVAAFIEAFWSSNHAIPPTVKYTVAALLWTGVVLWLWRGGQSAGEGTDAA